MSTFHNLFTWENREMKSTSSVFKNCIARVPMANKSIGEKIDVIVQDYLQCILIVKTSEGVTHIPYKMTIENLCPTIVHPDRVTQIIVERMDRIENRLDAMQS